MSILRCCSCSSGSRPAPVASASEASRPQPGCHLPRRRLLEPDNLNPFIGLLGQDTRSATSTTTTLSASTPWICRRARSSPRAGRTPTTARPGPSRSARASSGRTASRSRPTMWPSRSTTSSRTTSELAIYTGGITGATAIDDTTVEITSDKPKSDILAHVRPDPARAHLVQGLRQGGDHQLPE